MNIRRAGPWCNVSGICRVHLWKAGSEASYPLAHGGSMKANNILIQPERCPSKPAAPGAWVELSCFIRRNCWDLQGRRHCYPHSCFLALKKKEKKTGLRKCLLVLHIFQFLSFYHYDLLQVFKRQFLLILFFNTNKALWFYWVVSSRVHIFVCCCRWPFILLASVAMLTKACSFISFSSKTFYVNLQLIWK